MGVLAGRRGCGHTGTTNETGYEGMGVMSTLRRYVTPMAVIAALIVFYIYAPWGSFGLS